MFVNKLSAKEKNGLFQLLVAIARADGILKEDELRFLTSYANENNIFVDFSLEIDLEQACALISSYQAKVISLQEIIKIALVDGQYHEFERKGVVTIAEILSIPIQTFREIENWVIEGYRWVQRGEAMIAPVSVTEFGVHPETT